jgi:hypothetical protein
MTALLLLLFFFSRKKELVKKATKIDPQKKLFPVTIFARKKERKGITQDIHDKIVSKLNIIYLNFNLLLDGCFPEKEAFEVKNKYKHPQQNITRYS